MRRFVYWILPFSISLVAAGLFGWGFLAFLRGDTGVPVNVTEQARPEAASRKEISAVLLGDSLARGAGDEAGFGIGGRLDLELKRLRIPARRTYNLAVNGARTGDLLQRLESPNVQSLLAEANVIVVSIGGNDLWGGTDWRSARPPQPGPVMDAVLARIEQAIDRVRAVNPTARIFFIGLYNPFAATPAAAQFAALVNQWNARVAARFASDPEFTLVATADLFSHRDRLALDRFHPNGEGYAIIARRIAEAL
jgi:lysophospholipase L1-like esterase